MQTWTIKAYLIGIKWVGKVQPSGAAGIPPSVPRNGAPGGVGNLAR
jgi:hypothetical protein